MSSSNWPEHQEELRRHQRDADAVSRALAILEEKEQIPRQVAIRRLLDAAQSQHRRVPVVADDVIRTGRLPNV